MNSSWQREIAAVFQKELNTELRGKSGLITSGLFSIVTVVALSFAAYNTKLSGTLAAGMLWVAILFATIVSLPRIFLVEEEVGTMDILRLTARPHAVYWGKVLFSLAQAVTAALLLTGMFIAFTNQAVYHPLLLVASLLAGSACLASAVTLCGALVAQAANRAALAAAVSAPLLLPVITMAVGATRIALTRDAFISEGIQATAGLTGYAVASLAIGPGLFSFIWKS